MKFSLMIAALTLALLASNPSQAATIDANWTSAADVPVNAGAYIATGNSINPTLNFAPTTGATLTVVKNTGLPFITGAFSNLAQGQAVALAFDGVTYDFVANYYGGSGNDLVLQWANVRPMAWGNNGYGQLGNNTTTNRASPVPVQQSGVLSGKTVIAITGGHLHSLALCSDGTLASWGWDEYGQLGNNSTTDSSVPLVVNTSGVLAGKTVIAIAAGAYYSLALCSDGTLAG